jgi:hypothetical protein
MRIFILLCSILFAHPVWAETPIYHNPFSSYATANLTLSAATALTTPLAQSQFFQADALHDAYSAFTHQGMTLSMPNRRIEYIQANPYGMQGRQRIAEEIGDMGTQLYARKMNFQPLFEGKAGQGQGFDTVYRTDKQVIVVEAKGGSSQPKVYRGYPQGSRAYTLKVAEYVQNSKSASAAAKRAARAVIQAHKDGNLVVQVARTRHVYGTPQPTQVETTYGKLDLPSSLQLAHRLSLGAGFASAAMMGIFELMAESSSDKSIDLQRVITISALGGLSGYAGSLSGTLTQHALLSNNTLLLSSLSPTTNSIIGSFTGGATTSALLAYGLYFLGYSDLNSANRSMTAGLIGTAAGGIATAGLMAFATAVGTASTGTAIASLSGIAAHNAALAWLGGGALSAGGAGVAGGAMVLSGGALLAVVGASVAAMYLFQKGDEQTEQRRIEYLLASVKQKST